MSVVTTDVSRIVEHYREMKDLQKRGTPEWNAYHRIVSDLWSARGASLSFQRTAVTNLLHGLEQEGRTSGLYVDVLRSLKVFLSKTSKLSEKRGYVAVKVQ